MAREHLRERIYWSTAEAAAYIGFSEDTVWRWAKNATSARPKNKFGRYDIPKPPVIRFGKYFRFPIEEFKVWAKTPNNAPQQKARL